MAFSRADITKMAKDYTAAWNSKSADAVASFYAEDGEIVINSGDPWSGRPGYRNGGGVSCRCS